VEDRKWLDSAESIPGPTSECLSELAVYGSCRVTGSLFHKAHDGYLNTAVLIGRDGAIEELYSKTHIPDLNFGGTRGFESFYFSAGNGFTIWDINGIKLGILICYDRSFPEAWRVLTLRGASIVLVLASSSGFRSEMFVQELQIRAIENGVWVFAVNKGGDEFFVDADRPADFYGSSCVIAPDGQVLALMGREPNVGIARELDPSILPEIRSRLGYLKARRPDLYRDISTCGRG
jgi:N-carbamoylputrescine amidase